MNGFINPAKCNKDGVKSYLPLENLRLDIRGINFAMKLKDVSQFEKKNTYSMNVYGLFSENTIDMLHRTKNYQQGKHIKLFLTGRGKKHNFCLIIYMSR